MKIKCGTALQIQLTGTDPNMGRDRGAGRGPDPCKENFFPAPPLTIFIFLT